MVRLLEHDGPGHEELGIGSGQIDRVRGALGPGDVAGGLHEPAELGVGDRVLVDPEAVDAHRVDGPFLRVEVLGPHLEGPAGHVHHALPHDIHHHLIVATNGKGLTDGTVGRAAITRRG